VIKARGRVKVVEDCHLMINAVDTSDAGNYTCYVSNVAATKSVTVMLTVAGALCHVMCHVMSPCLIIFALSFFIVIIVISSSIIVVIIIIITNFDCTSYSDTIE